jgi:hypothetical protein
MRAHATPIPIDVFVDVVAQEQHEVRTLVGEVPIG